LKLRKLGNTGIDVSEVGFGAWQLGNGMDWGSMSDSEAIHLVHMAMDEGCTFFDTAPNYGQGKSERLLGQAFLGKRDKVVINTKFGHDPDGQNNFTVEGLKTSLETSLKKLQTDYIDTILIHNPPFELLNGSNTDIYEELEKLKKEGKIRAYGASVDSSAEMTELMRTTKSQVMEVLFNVFHQETTYAFPEAYEKGIGIIVKVPLDSGWLSGKYHAKSQFDGIRSRWSEDIIERRFNLLKKIAFITEEGHSFVQAALSYVLAFDEVSTVIPGVKNEAQLKENLSASVKVLSPEQINRLKAFWVEELKSSPLPW
jgi:aryl-alcohol dehydrogenase-like predicted oxidoreductase